MFVDWYVDILSSLNLRIRNNYYSSYKMNGTEVLNIKKEVTASLRDRVFYAARDGMAITMYALLSEHEFIAEDLLNQVSSGINYS